jgi:hypothetical protein
VSVVFRPYTAFCKDDTLKIISPDIVSDVNDVRSTKASLVNRGIELLIKVSDFRSFSVTFDKKCRDKVFAKCSIWSKHNTERNEIRRKLLALSTV